MDEIANFKKVCRSLLLANATGGMKLRELEKGYREMEGRQFPLFGYPSVISMLYTLTDTLIVVFQNGVPYVYPKPSEKTQHIQKLVAEQKPPKIRYRKPFSSPFDHHQRFGMPRPRPTRTAQQEHRGETKTPRPSNFGPWTCPPGNYFGNSQSNLRRSEKRDENGNHATQLNVSANKSPEAHDNCTLRESNVDRSAQAVNAVVPEKVVIPNSLPTVPKDMIEPNNNEIDVPDDLLVDEVNAIRIDDEFPIDLFNSIDSAEIEINSLPENMWHKTEEVGNLFKLFVSEVHSPYKFWLHIDSDVVDRLGDSLDLFYFEQKSNEKYQIPENLIKKDFVCVALFQTDCRWYRVRIVDILNPKSVLVFCVDFGTTTEVAVKNLRLLHKKFAALPMQAIRGCLDRVRPKHGLWTWESMLWFASMVTEVPFLGTITAINQDEKTVYLKLHDRKHGSVISDLLIEENHAVPTKKLLHNFVKRHYNEVYPSFQAIETGAYPSLEVMNAFKEEGTDFLLYQQSVINYEMLGYQTIE